MQKFILIITTVIALAACKDQSQHQGGATTQHASNLTPRNSVITRTNAYSDLFMDSTDMEAFIKDQQLNDTIITGLRNFYNARNYQYAWFATDGLTEQALAFRNLYDYTKDSSATHKALDRKLETLMADDTLQVSAADANIRKTELMLTWRYINYVWDQYKGASSRQTALEHFVPAQKQGLMQMAEAELKHNDAPNDSYKALKQQLKQYVTIEQQGGWAKVPAANKKLKKGSIDASVVLLKKRLQATGQIAASDSSTVFNDELVKAVQAAQSSYGLKADGIVTPVLLRELNVPTSKRIEQLLLNLERMRWIPAEPTGELIWVNIPEFKLYVRNGSKELFNMNVVVGKEGHSTVMFSGNLNQVVFSPYWNLPENIVKKEVLPDIAKNKNYLAENNMEITGEEDGVPVIRQLPGDKNQLGKIKFLFPNSFNIYFHDTPYKELFKQDKRAFSHGCIRLSEPVKLASFLLADKSEWTPEKIDSAMNSKREQYVRVKDPVPVLIYYYTAWVDENKVLQFRDDIYGHDKRLAQKLFAQSTVTESLASRQ